MRLEVLRWSSSSPPTESGLRADLVSAGLDLFRWSDDPGADYAAHSHDHEETICLVAGEITFTVAGRDHTLHPGDRLQLPAGTVHTARAGSEGATYLIGSARG